MIDSRFSALLLMLFAPDGAEPQRVGGRTIPPGRQPLSGTVIIQQRMIIRVPRLPAGRTPMPAGAPLPPITWVEKKTDKCIAADGLAGASITRADSVDLVMSGGKRLRARLDSNCPALDFYSGFYLKSSGDGQICAKRDTIRSRSGAACRIESFRALVPGR